MGPTLFDRDEANREKSRGIVKEPIKITILNTKLAINQL